MYICITLILHMKGLQVLSVMSHFDPVFYLEMSPLLGRGSMTMAFTGKLVYTEREGGTYFNVDTQKVLDGNTYLMPGIYIYIYIYIYIIYI